MSDDRDWDAELEAAAAVRRRYRDVAASDEPPAALDDAILAASRRAVSAGPAPLGASRWGSWRMPLAAAAVIVVSASVGLLMWDEKGHEQWPSAERGPVSSVASPVPESAPPMATPPKPPEELATRQVPAVPAESAKSAAPRPVDSTQSNLVRKDTYAVSERESSRSESVAIQQAQRQLTEPPRPAAPEAVPDAPAAPDSAVASDEPVAKAFEADRQDKLSEAPADAETRRSAAKSAPRRSEADAMESRELFAGAERAGRLRGSAPASVAPAAAPRVGRNDDGVEELRVIALLWEAGRQVDAVEALRRLRCSKPYVPIPPDFPVSLGAPLVCPQAAKEPSAPDR